MPYDKLMQDFETLSSEAQQQIRDLINSLKNEATSSANMTPLSNEVFVGQWQDRADLADVDQWVRSTRKREWREDGLS